jgi:hypothetical protein
LAADQITRSEITRLIDQIAMNAPVMARIALGYVSSFYSCAMPRLASSPGDLTKARSFVR